MKTIRLYSALAFVCWACCLTGLQVHAQSGNACIDSALINHNPCPDIVAPVCGCNGVTYSNSCVAQDYYGVTSWTNGACNGCNLNTTWTYTVGQPGTVTFTAATNNQLNLLYTWSFGDGTTGSGQVVTHTYAQSGNYNVCLTVRVTVDNCVNTYCNTISVQLVEPTCQAGFTYVNASPSKEVTFTNTSTANAAITSYSWTFGDGKTSVAKHPKHTYKKAGDYYVCLAISTANGCTSIYCDSVHVDIVGCEASFEFCTLPVPGMLPAPGLYVRFTNTSGGFYNQSYWTFGDGDTSTQTNPTHDYLFDAQPYYYLACLTVSGLTPCRSTGCDTVFTTKIPLCTSSDCINPSLIMDNVLCSPQYEPVCGCNGVTYTNACIAELYNGVSNWVSGPCPTGETAGAEREGAVTSVNDINDDIAFILYPNPTSGITHINYTLNASGDVEVQVMDVLGNVVATVFKGTQTAGQQMLSWNANGTSAGIYLVSIRQNEKFYTQRLSIMH